jgi:biotin operon repressor
MNTKDLAQNFVSQFNKPFDLNAISALIDRDPEDVKPVLAELLTAKQIKLVDPEQGIYVRDNRYNASVCYHQKGNWQFDPQAANALLDQIENGSYNSVRAIAQTIGRSRQWVFVYMEALASIGCVILADKKYIVVSRGQVKDIGKKIIPGILGSMRPKLTEEEKQQREVEKEVRRQEWYRKQEQRMETRRQKYLEVEAKYKARQAASEQGWRELIDSFIHKG